MSKNGEIYTTGKNFTLPPGLTGWTNFTSGYIYTESPSTCWILILFSYIKKDLLSRIMPITLATLQGAALVALDRVRRAWRDLPCHVFTVRNLSRRGSPIKRKGK